LASEQDGMPIAGAVVTAKLSGLEVDAVAGYILPHQMTATADAQGVAVLSLWPNQLGNTETFYEFKITDPATGKSARIQASIPNGDCKLHMVANLPPYEGKPDGQLAADAAAANAVIAANAANTAVAARDIATAARDIVVPAQDTAVAAANSAAASEASAFASKNAAGASAAGAAASEVNALASKNAANTAAANAATSEANALASKNTAVSSATNAATSEASALSSKNAAAASATGASTSATNAAGSATAAAGAATTATTKADEAAASATAAATSAQQAAIAAAGQVQADWSLTDASNKGFIKNKPALAAVATSGNKADIGLGSVDNTPDANKPVSGPTQTALNAKVNSSLLGAANGVATLGSDGKVPAGQLPSYVDDVIEVATKSALPATGETSKIYVVITDESRGGATSQYRWSGTAYTRIPTSPGSTDEVPEGSTNRYFTESRVIAALLTGLSTATNAVIGAGDSILVGIGKLQAQITAALASIATKAAKGANTDITSLAGLNSVEINAAVPYIYLNETDQSGSVGKWRILAEGGAFRIDMNTAAARDFSTAANSLLTIDSSGKCTTNGSVVQGGGAAQGNNRIYLGWGNVNGGLKCTVDATDQGFIPFSGSNPAVNGANFGFAATYTGLLAANGGLTASGNTILSNGNSLALTVNGNAQINYGMQVQGAPAAYFTCGGLLSSIGGTGMVQTGTTAGLNIVYDYQAIQARNNGAASTLVLNYYGGAVNVYSGGLNVYSGNGIYTTGPSFADGWGYFRATTDVKIGLYRGGAQSEGYIGASVGNNFCFIAINKDNTAYRFAVDNNGNTVAWGNVTAYSDERLKANWRDLGPGFIEKWSKVRYGVFDRKDIRLTQVGLSAQSVRAVLPYAVDRQVNGYLSVNYGPAAAVATVELAKEVIALRSRLDAQEKLIKKLMKKVRI
jgi:hypothetical protein